MIHIAACTDKGFVMPTGVMMHSVSKTHVDTTVTFHVLIDESVSCKQQSLLQSVIVGKHHQVVFYPMSRKQYDKDKRWKGGFTLPPAAYYRLSLAEVLPETIDRVLYLDGDIAVNGLLDDLFLIGLSDIPLMASLSYPPMLKTHTERLGYDSEYGYFNSGVLLINLNWWREHNVMSKFERIMVTEVDKIVLHDQDVLNMAFAKQKKFLSLRYNAQPWLFSDEPIQNEVGINLAVEDMKDAQAHPAIIHYCGRAKPWHTDCQHPLQEIYRQNMSETPWQNVKMHKSWRDGSLRDKFYYIIGNLKKAFKDA